MSLYTRVSLFCWVSVLFSFTFGGRFHYFLHKSPLLLFPLHHLNYSSLIRLVFLALQKTPPNSARYCAAFFVSTHVKNCAKMSICLSECVFSRKLPPQRTIIAPLQHRLTLYLQAFFWEFWDNRTRFCCFFDRHLCC